MVSFGFGNALGFLALLSLIPLIILYLIRPKPKQIDVPSLMFFQKDEKRKKQRAFFKQLPRDWLLLAQLLVLLLLGLFFTQPSITLGKSFLLENAVIVVDTSASTGVGHVFQQVIAKARDVAGNKNTVIVVSSAPHVGLENADKETTLRFLDDLRVSATESPIGEAMMLANQYVKGSAPHVFVISDFMSTGTTNIESAKQTLEKSGAIVHIVDVGEKKTYHNIGIIDVRIGQDTGEASIKNFDDQARTFDVSINGKNKPIVVNGGAIELVPFESHAGVTTITINVKDDLALDNAAYVSIPPLKTMSVLLISNTPSKYLQAALTASPSIKMDVAESLPNKKYEVYVIQNVNELSASDVAGLTQRVKDGAGLVIHAQDNMDDINYGGLLPIMLDEQQGFGVIQETQSNKFTKDIQFGGVQRYFSTRNDKGLTLASISNSSLISIASLGYGRVAYYGILESASDFTINPGYPVFWVNLVKYLGNLMTTSDLNRRGGSVLTFPEKKTVKTPSTTISTKALYLDEEGIYHMDDDDIAINLLSEKESSLAQESRGALGFLENAAAQDKIKHSLTNIFLYLALILLFIELLFVKLRGEI